LLYKPRSTTSHNTLSLHDALPIFGQAATAMSGITITDAATPTITTTKGIRVRIPATFNMTWNTALTTASITGSAVFQVMLNVAGDRKSTRLNSSHVAISYAVFCLK